MDTWTHGHIVYDVTGAMAGHGHVWIDNRDL
jgi:hypothetical protein